MATPGRGSASYLSLPQFATGFSDLTADRDVSVRNNTTELRTTKELLNTSSGAWFGGCLTALQDFPDLRMHCKVI